MKIKEAFDKDKIFFTSDTHFSHTNIITYCNRPFESAHEMNKVLTENWNKVVPEDGIVFHLGDFAFADNKKIAEIGSKLNGTIHFVLGNHDREKEIVGSKRFKSISDLLEITVLDEEVTDEYQKIIMCHYPMVSWHGSHKGWWHLYGHVHGNFNSLNPITIDVGVDVTLFKPLSYQDVKTIITKRALTAKRT